MDELTQVKSPPWSLRTRRTVSLIALLVIGLFAWRVSDIWPPVIVSLVLAYLLSPSVAWIERVMPVGSPERRRTVGTVLTFLLGIMAVVLVILLIVPAIGAQMRQFIDLIPALAERMESDLRVFLSQPINIGGQELIPLEMLGANLGAVEDTFEMAEVDMVGALQDLLGPLTSPVLGALGTVLSALISMIFVLTMIFYLMKDGPRFLKDIEELFPESYHEDVRILFRRLGEIWNAYLRGQLILSLTMGTVVFLAATILGLRSPLVLGLLSGVLEFIPNLGPALALIPAALFALFFPSATIPGLEGLFFMLIVVVVWTGLQNLEAIFLVPRIMGDSLDLHPFVVIVAVIGGASLAGALGVILAAPVVATLRLFADYLMVKLIHDDLDEAGPPLPVDYSLEMDSERP
ncbi:MAG: AI-2E family transporter [Anaerolineae bacterium]|nr:AI-2E family transporter [Anaerolineae bacterium]